MKTNACLLSFCIIALISFRATAQKYDPLVVVDTVIVPMIVESPTFNEFNGLYKDRLDAVQQRVPLNYNESVHKYIDIYKSRGHQFGKMLGMSEYYFPIFEKAFKAYDIPEEIKYLSIIESNLNPKAVSRVGATGIWQFMFGTAKGYGLNMDNYVDERRDPVEASYAAAAYFRDAYEGLGDWLLAIAAYNCGRGNVERAITKANSRDFWEIRPFLPAETRNYVPAFIAALYLMKFSEAHDIKQQPSALAIATDSIQVNRYVSIPTIAEAMNMEPELLYALNPSYKKNVINGTEDHPKRLVVPRITLDNFARVYDVLYNQEGVRESRVILASNDDRRVSKKKAVAKTPVKYHRVSQGQSLSSIAEKYQVEVQDLKVWNRLKTSVLMPGQRLIVSQQAALKSSSSSRSPKQYISSREKSSASSQSGKI
ncbi:membrane-bound lytic murein transglycosylase D [Pedobacter sp. CAN_A7]|uniref:lytic transglycosylase domain-containing protein n=1 Tax=Pedobacter sp. CAN_A7 TaxID=2787722 RepID=UPI0018CA4A27